MENTATATVEIPVETAPEDPLPALEEPSVSNAPAAAEKACRCTLECAHCSIAKLAQAFSGAAAFVARATKPDQAAHNQHVANKQRQTARKEFLKTVTSPAKGRETRASRGRFLGQLLERFDGCHDVAAKSLREEITHLLEVGAPAKLAAEAGEYA